MLKSEKVVK